jgi:hypothetical protein
MSCEDYTSTPPVSTTTGVLLSAANAVANRVLERLPDGRDGMPLVAIYAEEGLVLVL